MNAMVAKMDLRAALLLLKNNLIDDGKPEGNRDLGRASRYRDPSNVALLTVGAFRHLGPSAPCARSQATPS